MLPYLTTSCRVLIALMFLASILTKLRNETSRQNFLDSVRALTGSKANVSVALAAASIAAELGIVVFLTLPDTVELGFLASALLLAVYAAVLWRALKRGVRAPCQCIGSSIAPIHRWLIVRNLGLVAVSLIGAMGTSVGVQIEWSTGFATSVAIAVVGVLVVASFDDLLFLVED
jgi:hypothetical protein